MNITLTLMEDRLISISDIFCDLKFDVLALNTYLKLSDKVRIFGLFKLHTISILIFTISIILNFLQKLQPNKKIYKL